MRTLAAALTIAAIAWLATILAAPYAIRAHSAAPVTSAAVAYRCASFICHQRPERSFHLAGIQLPVCARCFGLYLSGAIGAVAGWAGARRLRDARTLLVVTAIPTALTWSLEMAGLAHPSNTVRAVSALPLGAAVGWVLVRMLRDGDETAI